MIPASRLYDLFENPRSLRPLEAEVIFDIPRSGEVIWVPYMGSKWPRQWLASGGLEWPRIFNEVVQPRGWNKIFAKLNFMHSLKRWAKSDYWNPSKSHIFCSKTEELVEAKIEVVFNSSKKTSMNPENLIFFLYKIGQICWKSTWGPFQNLPSFLVFYLKIQHWSGSKISCFGVRQKIFWKDDYHIYGFHSSFFGANLNTPITAQKCFIIM